MFDLIVFEIQIGLCDLKSDIQMKIQYDCEFVDY